MKQKRLRRIPGGEQNVHREIGLLQRLRHRNIIELYDVLFHEEKGKLYVVFEYCPVVLDDLLYRAPGRHLPPAQARQYFSQLLDGLEYLFSRGVIHRYGSFAGVFSGSMRPPVAFTLWPPPAMPSLSLATSSRPTC